MRPLTAGRLLASPQAVERGIHVEPFVSQLLETVLRQTDS